MPLFSVSSQNKRGNQYPINANTVCDIVPINNNGSINSLCGMSFPITDDNTKHGQDIKMTNLDSLLLNSVSSIFVLLAMNPTAMRMNTMLICMMISVIVDR